MNNTIGDTEEEKEKNTKLVELKQLLKETNKKIS